MEQNVIEVSALTKTFGKLTAVDNVNLSVQRGEIFGFIGPSGSGKTTTMRILCGILTPSSGKGHVGGFNIIKEYEKIKTIIGYTAQHFTLYKDLTVQENIDFFTNMYGTSLSDKECDKLLETVGLSEYKKMLAANLSGGTKQKLSLICAVAHKPDILFLDEPTTGIDPVSLREIWSMLYDFTKNGITVFMTTHAMEEAEHCNRLSFIYQGRIIAEGSPQKLKKDVMSADVIEISAETPLAQYIDIFQQLESVDDADTAGENLRITTKNIEKAKEQINKLGREKNLHLTIKKVVPSMEDVFVNLIGDMDNEASNTTH